MTTNHEALERQYRRLIRFYPRQYRAKRGEEIVGTYLDFAAPKQARPSVADVGDLLASALRQRLRHIPAGLPAGARTAAVVAMSVVAAMATAFATWIEPAATPEYLILDRFGPFQSLAVVTWTLWIAAAITAAFPKGRITRIVVLVPLAATVALIPMGTLSNFGTPPMYLVVPLLILGSLTLAWPDRPAIWMRVAPTLALAVTAAGILSTRLFAFAGAYRDDSYEVIRYAIAALVIAGVAAALVGYITRRPGGAWTLGILLPPAAMFAVTFPSVGLLVDIYTTPSAVNTDFASIAVKAAVVLLLLTAVPAAVAMLRRRRDVRVRR